MGDEPYEPFEDWREAAEQFPDDADAEFVGEEFDPPPYLADPDDALKATIESPDDPQAYLEGSQHPYAPFTGNALQWVSWVWDDATTYEGLGREFVPHGKGVMTMGKVGAAAGIDEAKEGDMYEGEFHSGFAQGLGQYTSTQDAYVYRGDWYLGKKHGCGMDIDFRGALKAIKEEGMDPNEAWRGALQNARYGLWEDDDYVGEPGELGPGQDLICSREEVSGVMQEVDDLLTRARMFQHKPDGEVALRFLNDGSGLPAPRMQDPLHYPHNTKFMAPGPMGQCFPVPNNPQVRSEMLKHAANYKKIYEFYNFHPDPWAEPDSIEARSLAWAEDQQMRARFLRQLRGEETEDEQDAGDDGTINLDPNGPAAAADDDELYASYDAQPPARGSAPPTVFASLSLGLGHAAAAAAEMIRRTAERAPRRRALARPSRHPRPLLLE